MQGRRFAELFPQLNSDLLFLKKLLDTNSEEQKLVGMIILMNKLLSCFLFVCFRLRELLASEENEYFTEMQSKGETIEEKKDKMRERTKFLREKKEKERQDFVAEKLEQQFR